MQIYEELVQRGLIAQVTDEKEIREPGEKRIGDWLEKEWKN